LTQDGLVDVAWRNASYLLDYTTLMLTKLVGQYPVAIYLKRPLIYSTATARLTFNSGDEIVDLTNNKIRPFFHIQNFKGNVQNDPKFRKV
jgi:hypothetical protein